MAIYIFYDSFSKMYLIYSTLCYIITFSPATGYVLLAANIEDFRTLAKRLIPDHLAHLADDIFDIAKDVVIKESVKQNSIGFRHKPDTFTKGITLEQSGEAESRTTRKKHRKHKTSETITSTTPYYDLNIDELVEKVKQKLKNEFQLIPPKNYESKNNENLNSNESEDENSKITHNNHDKGKNGTQADTQNDQNSNKKLKERKGNNRYVADVYVANPPKFMLESNKNKKSIAAIKGKETYDTYTEENKNSIDPTEANDLFVEVDLGNWNDSYEENANKKNTDYKDDVESTSRKTEKKVIKEYVTGTTNIEYIEDEETTSPETQKKFYKNTKIKEANVHSDKELSIFSDEVVTKYSDYAYIDETENYNTNKAIRNSNVTLTDIDENETFQPYSKQLQSAENVNSDEKRVTENNLELSHIVLLDDDEDKRTGDRVTPKMNVNLNPNKFVKNGRPKKNTVIPKRDFYKISSPNYLLKVPIIGERYHFDEPIPEEDRDAENLKYIGNPPASINGKIELTI